VTRHITEFQLSRTQRRLPVLPFLQNLVYPGNTKFGIQVTLPDLLIIMVTFAEIKVPPPRAPKPSPLPLGKKPRWKEITF
jgi:hypothetical protein